jgi:mannose-6-phosphate isomerase-like protein (cupin superfamily)
MRGFLPFGYAQGQDDGLFWRRGEAMMRCGAAMVCGFVMFGGGMAVGQAPAAPAAVLSEARVYTVEEMPVRKMANGGESRDILRGVLPTGEAIAAHESMQVVGAAPNAPHTIDHSEVITVMEGMLSFEHDGKSEKVGPGGVIFVAMGTMHTVKNVGDGPAKYVVVQIGGDTKR